MRSSTPNCSASKRQAVTCPQGPLIRTALVTSWPIASSSFARLAVLVVPRLAGVSASTAAYAGLAAAIALLTFHGWSAAQAAQLRGWQLAGSTAVAAGLGLVMVALKYLMLLHLH